MKALEKDSRAGVGDGFLRSFQNFRFVSFDVDLDNVYARQVKGIESGHLSFGATASRFQSDKRTVQRVYL